MRLEDACRCEILCSSVAITIVVQPSNEEGPANVAGQSLQNSQSHDKSDIVSKH